MIRKHKKFAWPKKLYDKPRIIRENKLVASYGLKNKKEIWKTEAKVNYLRSRAKSLMIKEGEEQVNFISKLNKLGLEVNSISDVLSLNVEDLLKRRLSTIIVSKSLANTPKHARQMIVHKMILVDGKMINSPSYIVGVDEESKIQLKNKNKKPKPEKDIPKEEANTVEEISNG